MLSASAPSASSITIASRTIDSRLNTGGSGAASCRAQTDAALFFGAIVDSLRAYSVRDQRT
jgi:hypothetical protein